MTTDLYNELGVTEGSYIPISSTDVYHYSPKGAEVVAGLVVDALPRSLAGYVVGNPSQRREP